MQVDASEKSSEKPLKAKRAKKKETAEEIKQPISPPSQSDLVSKAKTSKKLSDDELKTLSNAEKLMQLTVEVLKKLCFDRNLDIGRGSKRVLVTVLQEYVDNL